MDQAGGAGGEDGAAPLSVLFVCTANICRSAFAEVLARHLAGTDRSLSFASAGTYGLPAHPMSPEIAAFLPDGVTPGDFASRRVTAGIVAGAELILTAEAEHRRFILEEYPTAFRKVLTVGQFAEAAARSEVSGRALLGEVARLRPPARTEHDVFDPYGRGRAANEAAAAQITRLLEIVIPALLEQSMAAER